jgi:hypothetical protein
VAERAERRYRRYNLRFPVHLQFVARGSVSEVKAISRNLSVGGMLIEADTPIPQYCPVMLTITMKGAPLLRSIQLTGQGRVVRVIRDEPGFAIAVECSQPISQMEPFLTASEA